MTRDRTHLLLSYLALALAGVCLTCAELDFLPELAVGLPLYLVLVGLAWRMGGRRMLPMWVANLLGLVIASGRPARRSWVLFGLRWILAVGVLAWPLFLLMPRVDVPEWEPLAHFTIRRTTLRSLTGFSDEIDLNRTGRISVDDSLAFRVVA